MKTYKLKIPIKKLFQFLNVDNDLYDCIQPSTRNVSIQAPDGKYVKILAFVKKRGNVRSFKTDIGSTITCDEKHLIKQSNGTYAHIKNTNHVIIKNRPHKIIESVRLGTQDVYDIALDYPHEYITASEIVCHNTTAGKILCKNIDCDMLYINASDENNVETVRNKIKNFASSVGFKDLKVVFLDEADGTTPQAQSALRNLMEVYSLHTRFILTANYVDRIIEPLVSRTQVYELAHPSRADVAKYLVHILTEEEIKFNKEDVVTLVQAYHPDIRRIVNTAQMQSKGGELKLDEKKLIESDFKLKIVSLLCDKRKTGLTKWREIRQLIADEGIRDFTTTYRALYDHVEEIAGPQTPAAIVLIKEHAYQDNFIVDHEICFASLVHQLMQLSN